MLKKLTPYIAGALVAYFGYNGLATVMYTHALVQFHDNEHSVWEHGLSRNGKPNFGNLIDVSDLSAKEIKAGGSSVEELCEDVKSTRGHATLSFVGGAAVCCWAGENQRLIPYKDIGGTRHYLCGEWPKLDHVTQPIEKSKLEY